MGFTTGTHRLYNQISVGFVPQEINMFKLGGSIGLVFDMRYRFSGISMDNWTVTHMSCLYINTWRINGIGKIRNNSPTAI